MSQRGKIAERYAQSGLYVFPCWPGTKRPITRNGFKAGTTDTAQIARWWAAYPDANIGVWLEPSGICVLDFDYKHGAAETELRMAEITADAPVVRTPGGRHYWFLRGEHPALRSIAGDRKDAYPGCDVLSAGYVIAAGSEYGGKPYTWERDGELRQAPRIVFDLVAAASNPKPGTQRKKSQPAAGAVIGEGGRNRALFALGCSLRAAGLDYDAILAALEVTNDSRCDPPLPADEVATLARQASKYDGDDIAGAAALRDQLTATEPEPELGLICELVTGDEPPEVKLPTGNTSLDGITGGGLAIGNLSILAAPPGSGKTTTVIDLALRWQQDRPVLLVSAEIQAGEIAARIIGNQTGLSWAELRKTTPSAQRKELYSNTLRDKALYVLGEREISRNAPAFLKALASRMVQIEEKHQQTPIVIVDYLQKLAPPGTTQMEAMQVLVDGLATCSREANTCILGVSAVSRAYYGSGKMEASAEPDAYMAASKGLGDIDYHMHTLIYQELVRSRKAEGWYSVRYAVAKCRSGQVGFGYGEIHLASGQTREIAEFDLPSDINKPQRNTKPAEKADITPKLLHAVAELEKLNHLYVTVSQLAQITGLTLRASDLEAIVADGRLNRYPRHPITHKEPPNGGLFFYSRH